MGTFSELGRIAGAFLRLGVICFGGPVAHLGYFHDEFVRRRCWLDEAVYSDLVALCQALPGPSSSQVAFGLGMRRAGVAGGLVASVCFLLPSAVLMVLFALGVGRVGDLKSVGWLHGLKLAAVAVVAQAVWGMGKRLCPDRARMSLCLAAAGTVLLAPSAPAQVAVLAAGAIAGWLLYRREPAEGTSGAGLGRNHLWAAGTLIAFAVLLVGLPVAARSGGQRAVAAFDSFFRAGSLVFGGGHVVLPLLRAEVVPAHWVSDEAFLAGYGAAQAVPGPLFTFAAYLGTLMGAGAGAWLMGAWCLVAIFLPGWMLVGGTLPFWNLLRGRPAVRACLLGANAAVVGILVAALYNPVWTQAVRGGRDAAAALVAFALLSLWRTPPWLVVALAAAAGQWLLG